MAGWIKSLRQQDGSFVIVISREITGTCGNAALIEDFITRASPLEFANAILRAHGVEPAHVFAAWPASDPAYVHNEAVAPHAAVMAKHEGPIARALEIDEDEEEPPLRACANGGCGE